MAHELETLIFMIIGFLGVAVFTSVLMKKLRFPYTIGLVLTGFVGGLAALRFDYEPLTHLDLTPETILFLVLPTLIYDAAINMDIKALRRNLIPILLLAVPGLLVSAGIIGLFLHHYTFLGVGAALLFGTLISATDPVAVIALFSEIGAPRRLVTLVDGESIFNDATAIVLFTIILSAALNGIEAVDALLLHSGLTFLMVLLGGLLIGAVIGALGGLVVRAQRNNAILQITISLMMAYLSFLAADHLGVSGVMSTLAAGIVVSLLTDEVIPHDNHHFHEAFWDFFSFVANSFVFLLLGLTEAHSFSDPGQLAVSLRLLALVIPVVTLARAVAVYALIPVHNLFSRSSTISLAYQTVMFWGGLRGAIPVALVLAVPKDFPNREHLLHITLGYILFTLLVQGTTVKKLMAFLRIRPDTSYFDYHGGVSYEMTFPTLPLVDLVTSRVLSAFKHEGFFVSSPAGNERTSHHLSRGQKHLAIDVDQTKFRITAADQQDLVYGRQTVYETLVELDQSVASLEHLVKSPEMSQMVKEDETEMGGPSKFKLEKYLKPSLIEVSLSGTTKQEIIPELVHVAARQGNLEHPDRILQAVLEREATMSTGFENGIAIPHAKCDISGPILLAMGLHRDGVDFDSIDGKPTQIFFLVISPKSQVGPHIQLLAEIGRKMSHPETRGAVLSAQTPSEVINALK